jgi:exonuclease III
VDVLALQEVKLPASALPGFVHRLNAACVARAVQRRRQHSGFSFRAAPNTQQVGAAGVMLLFRQALFSKGDFELQGDDQADYDWGGRMVAATAQWRGHNLGMA